MIQPSRRISSILDAQRMQLIVCPDSEYALPARRAWLLPLEVCRFNADDAKSITQRINNGFTV